MDLRSQFARSLRTETAFDVLAVARRLAARGKDVVGLHIGDSPFPSPEAALQEAQLALKQGQTHYCESGGLPQVRQGVARWLAREFGVEVSAEQVVLGPGAKIFELLFCEAVLDPGDDVLVFSPHFPTYLPNIERRQARAWLVPLRAERQFRPDPEEVARFLREAPRPKAIFLNSPHNPTGGVTTAEDLAAIAALIRGREIAVFSDEPYCHMVWQGQHRTLLQWPEVADQVVAAYTLSKSYSMSGWRIGFAVASRALAATLETLINTSLSCTPPFVQLAALAALEYSQQERDHAMAQFRRKVEILVRGLQKIDGIRVQMPAGTFYAFPDVSVWCRRYGITSHGLAMYLLEGADDRFGVACLGGECFGEAGLGFVRFSCAEPDERLEQAVAFIGEALERSHRVREFLEQHPHYRLTVPL
ncbi:MAG: aminotransferase class I/II-fold pyridoxal phosphate-dependent enzyme [Gemmatales bacterium]|nr:aminotransferase class I/II-fold pyridoxal phosphate-dependent enzyme [Gemmatales bacterium]MCS7161288.1 aminotransferase class I/II-fold pyridoxal phosphate-dependent enzyme [Gemmatales bacterium]MDW8176491.1 aminotransferase class I/II-fold pyridoxal phosphate-dependent enzyme [Gemmatales bacterium]MDW8222728.1 aminotransferase class I/II-fold pyridoxal phosphate-dependent enzyme [Gemmatales bacterium]